MRVLYVDDEPECLELGRVFLEQGSGMEVTTADSGPAALDRLAQASYDAVVSDYRMPGMSGIELLKLVRAQGNQVPFVIFTGRGREEAAVEALQAGADSYLQKGGSPLPQFTELTHCLRQAVRRHQTEEALRRSEERYRRMVETAGEGIWVADRDGRTTFVNRRMAEMLGYSVEELIGRRVAEFLLEGDLADHQAKVAERLQGKSTRYERRFRRKDGRVIWTHVCGAPLRERESIVGLFAMVTDITDRKRMEQALRHRTEELQIVCEHKTSAEGRLRQRLQQVSAGAEALRTDQAQLRQSERDLVAVVYNVPIPQFVIDRAHRVIHWNRALEETSGILSQKMLGTTEHWRAFYPEERPTMADLIIEGKEHLIAEHYRDSRVSATVSGAHEATGFFPHLGNGGKWLRFTAGPIWDDQGEIIGAVETLVDITARVRAEKALKEALRKLHLLSSITRHDIRNRLFVLRGHIELARRTPERFPPADALEMMERAAEAISRQIEFTKDYENLGMSAPDWQDVDRLVDEAAAELPLTGCRLESELRGVRVYADAMLGKVFHNLIHNSLRHGGRPCSVRVSWRRDAEGPVLLYEDNGVGIPDERKADLFQPGRAGHSGMGLFLCREILAITGMTIRENGESGRGARFEIRVPEIGFEVGSVGVPSNDGV